MDTAPLEHLRPELLRAAQDVYDAWVQDASGFSMAVGFGGICGKIATAFFLVCDRHGHQAMVSSSRPYEAVMHFVCITDVGGRPWVIDIPWERYERLVGERFVKLPEVVFCDEDLHIAPYVPPDTRSAYEE